MNWLETTKAVVQLAPSIFTMIAGLEQLFGKGNGKAKKDILMASLADAAPSVSTAASALIDTTVAGLNKAGVFPHGQTAVPAK